MKLFTPLLTLCLLSLFALQSCYHTPDGIINDSELSDNEGKVQVRFTIGSIEQTPFPELGGRAVSLSSVCSRFSLALFQGETKIKTINQTVESEDFGTISLSLLPGNYQLVAIAHKGVANCTISSPDKITFANNKLTDTFFTYQEISITQSSAISLQLSRPVSMFRLNITDAMPTTVSQMKFYYTGGSSTFNAVTGFGCVQSKQTEIFSIPASAHGLASSFEVYTFPHETNDLLTVKVSALSAEGDPITETTFADVPIKQNCITEHTTSFFGNASADTTVNLSSSSITLLGDGQWQETLNY